MARRKKSKLPTTESLPVPQVEPVVSVPTDACQRCGKSPLGTIFYHVLYPGNLCAACWHAVSRFASPKAIQTPTNPERG